jgi:flagellar hook-length control protein FliK
VSSHLTIIQGGAAAPNAVEGRAGKAGKAEAGSPLAAFAAILDALLAGATAGLGGTGDGDGTTGTDGKIDPLANPMTGSTALASDAKAAHKVGAKDGDDDKDDDADPLAAFVDLLSQLDAALQSGQTPDPALLQKLDAAVADLSNLLGFDPDAPVAPGTAGSGGNTLIDQLAGKTESLARALDKTLTEPLGAVDANAQKAVADLTRRLDALAHKLEGGLSKDDLAKLGFDAELKLANTDTAKKLDALINGKVGLSAAVNATPDLAAPSLKPSKVEVADSKPVPAGDRAEKPDHKKPNEDKHAERIAAARMDAKADAAADTSSQQPADGVDAITQPATQASAGKIDGAPQLRGPAAAYQANPQINMPHLAFEMVRQVHNGKSRFQIRLDPPELGRIDVHMHVDNSGNVSARMTVDKAETLDLLQRDQSSLEKALAQAGLDGNKPNLEFSLRQNPFARPDGGQQQPGGQRTFNGGGSETANTADAAEPAPTLYRGTVSAGGVNLFV